MKEVKNSIRAFAALMVTALVCAWFVYPSIAAPLDGPRNTPEVQGVFKTYSVSSGAVIHVGAMVALHTVSGTVVPADDTTNLIVVGRAEQSVDSRLSGDLTVLVRRGVFAWENGGSFDESDIGSFAYVEDDQTVQAASAATHDVIAGVIYDVTDDGVWVDMRGIPTQAAASLDALTVAGNAAVGGTLQVSGASTVAAMTSTAGFTAPAYSILGTTTGRFAVVKTGVGSTTNSLVFIVGTSTNMVQENVQ